jgi:hypothetical protein
VKIDRVLAASLLREGLLPDGRDALLGGSGRRSRVKPGQGEALTRPESLIDIGFFFELFQSFIKRA